jgi:nucleotide-binding universal stress UspA family protein
LTVCHVIRNSLRADPLLPGLREGFVDGLPALRDVALRKVRARVARCTGRVESEYEALIEDGSPSARIVDAAEARSASLVVVGAHPRERHNHRLIGSVTERVVRHAHCPVLVLRPGPSDGPVLVATDFSDPAASAVAAAAGEARRRRAPLAILHCLEVAISGGSPREDPLGGSAVGLPLDALLELRDAARARLQALRAKLDLAADLVVAVGPASQAILQAVEDRGASLVVVGTKGRTGWKRVLLGSVAESVVQAAPCSVLVARVHHRPAPALTKLRLKIRRRT